MPLISMIGALAIALQSASAPADPPSIDCVLVSVPDKDAELLRRSFIATATDQQDVPDDTARDTLNARGEVCQAKHGWDDNATTGAKLWAMATIARPLASDLLKEANVDPAMIEGAYTELPAETRVALVLPDEEDTAVTALIEAVQRRGGTTYNVVAIERIGMFAALLAMTEQSRDMFDGKVSEMP